MRTFYGRIGRPHFAKDAWRHDKRALNTRTAFERVTTLA